MPITRSRKSKRSSRKSSMKSSMKSRHFNKRSNKTKKNKRVRFNFRYKGGVNTQTLQPLPNQVYSFPPGSTTSSNSSQNYLTNMSKQQADLNALHSGGGKKSKRSSRSKRRGLRRYFRGGDYYSYGPQDPNSVSVSQFSTTGPNVSPMTANNSSVANNVTLISGKNNALNDCYADNSCPS